MIKNRYYYILNQKNRLVTCGAILTTTVGIVPPGVIEVDKNLMGVSEEVTALAARMPIFEEALLTVPSLDDDDHDEILEANSRSIHKYAKNAFSRVFARASLSQPKIDALFRLNITGVAVKNGMFHTTYLKNISKLFSRGEYANFWDAVSYRAQQNRDLMQQIPPGVIISESEFLDNVYNLAYIGRGFGYSSKVSQSKVYILGTSREQKEHDSKAFQKWFDDKSSTITFVVRMGIADIPLLYDVEIIAAFEADPQNKIARLKLERLLVLLQNEVLTAWRKSIVEESKFDAASYLAGK